MTKSKVIALPFSEWPVQDQVLWKTALAPNPGIFKKVGWASDLAPATISLMQANYAVWLRHLKRIDAELEGLSPSQRVTRVRLDSWLAEFHSRGNRATTIYCRLRGLHDAIRMMEPRADLAFILRPDGYSLRKILRPEPRWKHVRDSGELLSRALALFQSGKCGEGYANGKLAIRDAAILGLLAAQAPRVGSVGSMQLGARLLRNSSGFSVSFAGHDMKTREAHGFPLQTELTEVLGFYIDKIRPLLVGQRPTDMLWIGHRGEPMQPRDIGKMVRRRCRDWFGVAEGPHWFRKCLRTTASLEGPEFALDASAVLAHSPETSVMYYVKAQASRAAERHGIHLAKLRQRTAPLAASAFDWREAPNAVATMPDEGIEPPEPAPTAGNTHLGQMALEQIKVHEEPLVWRPCDSK